MTPLQPSISADLIPGEYRVRIADPAAGTFLRGIGTPSADLRVEPLILDPSRESVEILGITGESEGIVLEGRLVSTDPEWSAEHIVISAAAIDRTVEVAVGADGSFRIPAMMPGAWWMRVPLTPQIASAPIPILVPESNVNDLVIDVPAPVSGTGPLRAGLGPLGVRRRMRTDPAG